MIFQRICIIVNHIVASSVKCVLAQTRSSRTAYQEDQQAKGGFRSHISHDGATKSSCSTRPCEGGTVFTLRLDPRRDLTLHTLCASNFVEANSNSGRQNSSHRMHFWGSQCRSSYRGFGASYGVENKKNRRSHCRSNACLPVKLSDASLCLAAIRMSAPAWKVNKVVLGVLATFVLIYGTVVISVVSVVILRPDSWRA